MNTPPDDTWAILKSLPDRPEYVPRGYEFLPDAFKRYVQPHGHESHELVCQALAEGDIVALLQSHLGHRVAIPQRIWNKFPLPEKVYPRFSDGKIRMGLHDHEGPYLVGWAFVPEGALAQLFSRPVSMNERSAKFLSADLEKWYQDYIEALVAEGRASSRDEDLRAAREAYSKPIPRERLRELRQRFAPPEWQRGGRRPEKSGRI